MRGCLSRQTVRANTEQLIFFQENCKSEFLESQEGRGKQNKTKQNKTKQNKAKCIGEKQFPY